MAVAELMARYSFDVGPYALNQWIDQWLIQYPALWLRSAVVEALYQGRYKAVSVWQILDLWQRRGQPLQHFNREFERMVTGRSFQLLFPAEPAAIAASSVLTLPQSRSAPGSVTGSVTGSVKRGSLTQPDSDLRQPDSPGLIATPIRQLQSQEAAPSSHVIQPFRPAPVRLSLPDRRQLIQPRSPAPAPVQRFIPIFDRSEFHTKLKSMAAALVRANAQLSLAPSAPALPKPADDPSQPDPEASDSTTPAPDSSSPEAQAENN